MAKQPYGGVYSNMDFKPYTYQEYPKHIPVGHGRFQVAGSLEEEKRILARLEQDDDNAPAEIPNYVADHGKEVLISRAAELGVAINRKWSIAKIKEAIESAELEADDLPPEQETADASEEGMTEEEVKEKLVTEAKELGIPATRVWGIPRLRKAIAEFKGQ